MHSNRPNAHDAVVHISAECHSLKNECPKTDYSVLLVRIFDEDGKQLHRCFETGAQPGGIPPRKFHDVALPF